jgi:TolB protein
MRARRLDLLQPRGGELLMPTPTTSHNAGGTTMRTTIAKICAGLILLVAASSAAAAVAAAGDFHVESTIAFGSNRDNPALGQMLASEVYLIDPDGTNVRRLTHNTDGDGFAVLSPDGKKIIFDSNRDRAAGEALNTSDLFLMNPDGSEQTHVTRGSSANWSPDGRNIAFHASASGSGTPLRTDPGSATTDSDIFVANLDDVAAGVEQPRNITNSPDKIDDDADWSPDGQSIVYTAHAVNDDPPSPPFLSNSAEIYVIGADGTETPERLTYTSVPDDELPDEEERAPAWSPDGTRIVYSCRIGGGSADFEICVINADGSNRIQLTANSVADLTATWSPDGEQIVFHRPVAGQGNQLFTMTPALNPGGTLPVATQITSPPGISLLANWGELRVHDQNPAH